MNDWVTTEQVQAKGENKLRVSKWERKPSKGDRVIINGVWCSGLYVKARDWYVGNFIYINITKPKPIYEVVNKRRAEAIKTGAMPNSCLYPDDWSVFQQPEYFDVKSVLLVADDEGLRLVKNYLNSLVQAIWSMDTVFTRERMTVITAKDVFWIK